MSSEIVKSAAGIIATAFDLDDDALAPTITLDDVRRHLVDRIIALLNRSPERLMSILYRIDVSEQSVNDIFTKALPPDVPALLADLIIERQLQKVESRRQARS